jgi:hypothetical protein
LAGIGGRLKLQFDFTSVFEEIGKLFVRGLFLRMRNQIGIDGVAYSPDAPSTIKGRARRKAGDKYVHFFIKREGKGGTHRVGKHYSAAAMSYDPRRLWHTGRLAKGAFDSLASKDSVKVFVKDSFYAPGWGALDPSKRQTFSDIIGWNSRGQSEVNTNIKSPPLVFPTDTGDLLMMEKEMKFAKRMFDIEAEKQMNKLATLKLRKVLKIAA